MIDYYELYEEAKNSADAAEADGTDFGMLKGTVLNDDGKINVDFVQYAYSEFDIMNAAYGQKQGKDLYKDTSIAVYPDTLCIIKTLNILQ